MSRISAPPITLALALIFLPVVGGGLAGCGASVSEYRYEQHAIRIDRTRGDAEARVYVDECAVDGLYYDRGEQQWGVEGYSYGPTYWTLDDLAEDMASWGAGECGASATRPDEATPAARADGFAAR